MSTANGELSLLSELLCGSTGRIYCSGTYLPPRHVLTAAHSEVTPNESVQVAVPRGDPAGVVHPVAAFPPTTATP